MVKSGKNYQLGLANLTSLRSGDPLIHYSFELLDPHMRSWTKISSGKSLILITKSN